MMRARFCGWRGPTGYRCTMPRIWSWRSGKAYLLPRWTAIFKRQRLVKGWRLLLATDEHGFTRIRNREVGSMSVAGYLGKGSGELRLEPGDVQAAGAGGEVLEGKLSVE